MEPARGTLPALSRREKPLDFRRRGLFRDGKHGAEFPARDGIGLKLGRIVLHPSQVLQLPHSVTERMAFFGNSDEHVDPFAYPGTAGVLSQFLRFGFGSGDAVNQNAVS